MAVRIRTSFLLFLFLGSGVLNRAMGALHIHADPKVINVGLTDLLTINCTFHFEPQDNAADIASIIISGRPINNATLVYEELASVSTFTGSVPTKLTNHLDFTVSGDIDSLTTPFLAMHFQAPDSREARMYRCSANLLDTVGHFFTRTAEVGVDFNNPDTDLLISQIRQVSDTVDIVSDQVMEVSQKATKLTDHVSNVNSQFNQSLLAFSTDVSRASVLSNGAAQDVELLKTEVNRTVSDFDFKIQQFYANLSTSNSQLNRDINAVQSTLEMINSSYVSEVDTFQKEMVSLRAADQNCDASLQAFTSTLNSLTQRLIAVEDAESRLQMKLGDLKALLFDTPLSFNNSLYYLSKHNYRDMNIAEAMCEIFGGYLVEIDSSDEHDFLSAFVNNYSGFDGVLVSGTDEVTEGHWVFQYSQDVISYDGWADKQPAAGANNCRGMWKSLAWKMIVLACNDYTGKARILCEVPL